MAKSPVAILQFDPALNVLESGKLLTQGLSVACQIGRSLWLASDESLNLERLTQLPDVQPWRYAEHRQYPLADYLDLPGGASEEADIEGLACAEGYLWLVGSHSLKRKKPKLDEGAAKARRQLAKVTADGNRYLLARIPMRKQGDDWELAAHAQQAGKSLFAARLKGDEQGNELTEALRKDPHLGAFLSLPGKDNGFDIEGLAAHGERLFIGLRGPVLRGWAVVLEIALREDAEHSRLQLEPIGPDGQPYRKHFLQLGGLGIRDLCFDADDLLILAGPTLDLDGPVRVFRWPAGATPGDETMVPADGLKLLLDLPFGVGDDHAEGMTLGPVAPDRPASLVIVHDSTSDQRRSPPASVEADIVALP